MSFSPADLSEAVPALFRYASGVTRDPDWAADVVQDTVVRALERSDQYTARAPLQHWLIRIAHNLIVDQARRSAREISVDAVEDEWRDDRHTVEAEMVVERSTLREEMLDALVRLPFIYRSAVVLHDVEGLRVVDVASIHEISLPAAKQRLRRGRMALVDALADGHKRRVATKGVPLNCWDARQHVSDYLNGDLDESTSEMLERHLGKCPTCPPLYAALVGAHGGLGRLRDPDSVVAPDLEQRIRLLLDQSA